MIRPEGEYWNVIFTYYSAASYIIKHILIIPFAWGKSNIKIQYFHRLACGVYLSSKEGDQNSAAQFGEILDLNVGYASGKHFVIQGRL